MTIIKYTNESKQQLKKRIDDYVKGGDPEKSRIVASKIHEIIKINNPNFQATKNSSGIILLFNKLSDITYKKIENYLNLLDNEQIKKIKESMDRTSEFLNSELITETSNTNEIKKNPDSLVLQPDNTKFKLSNKEKNMIKRKEYETELEKDNGVFEEVKNFDEPLKENTKKTKPKSIFTKTKKN